MDSIKKHRGSGGREEKVWGQKEGSPFNEGVRTFGPNNQGGGIPAKEEEKSDGGKAFHRGGRTRYPKKTCRTEGKRGGMDTFNRKSVRGKARPIAQRGPKSVAEVQG